MLGRDKYKLLENESESEQKLEGLLIGIRKGKCYKGAIPINCPQPNTKAVLSRMSAPSSIRYPIPFLGKF